MKNILTILLTVFAFSLVSAQLTIKAPNGDVGVGTDTPAAKLDVRGNIQLNNPANSVSSITGAADNKRLVVSNNTNTLNSRAFFEMFGANPSARAGEFAFGGTYLRFHSNVTNTSFGQENMRLTDAGRLGIGITSPAALLHVNGQIMNAGGTVSSDRRLKKDIKKYTAGLEEILNIEPYFFHYNGKAGIKTTTQQVGIMAQDLEKIAPYAVGDYIYEERDHENNLKSSNDYKCANTDVIVYMLVNSIKEQQKIIDDLQQKVENLLEANELPTSIEDEVEINNSSYLGQNYPNPHTDISAIDYSISSDSKNSVLQVVNISGQLVKEIKITANKGTIELNMQNLPSGIYNYSLISDNKILSTKQMIVK